MKFAETESEIVEKLLGNEYVEVLRPPLYDVLKTPPEALLQVLEKVPSPSRVSQASISANRHV